LDETVASSKAAKAVGFLPENPYFYKYLTGAETLRFFRAPLRNDGRNIEESRK